MKRENVYTMKKLVSLVLILTLVLTLTSACGNSNTSSAPVVSVAPSSVPEPEPVIPYEPSVLTGLKYEGTYPQDTRIAAVMINNISNNVSHDIRPQRGLSEADILVEMKVEGGITRFLAVFPDYQSLPEQLGPIRSARDQFFQVVLPFQPLFIHIGESVVQSEYKRNYDYEMLDVNLDQYANSFYRDQTLASNGVATWEIAFSTNDTINSVIENAEKDTQRIYTSTIFNFVNYDEPERTLTGNAEGANAKAYKVDILHSETYRSYFTYNSAKGTYDMSQYSSRRGGVHDTTDANNGEQLTFKNVVVLFTDIHAYPGHEEKDLQYVDLTSGGIGYYFSNGQAEEIRWQKSSPQGVLRLLDKFGNESDIQINPGKTYLSVVDLDMANQFMYYATEEAANGTDQVVVNSTNDNTAAGEAE